MGDDTGPGWSKLALYIAGWTAAFGALGLGFLGFRLPVPLVLALGTAVGGFSWVLGRGVHVADALVWPSRPNAEQVSSEANKDPRTYQLNHAISSAFVHDDWARLARAMTQLVELRTHQRSDAPELSAPLQAYLDTARINPAKARLRDQATLSRHLEEIARL